jgi:hypothetical protein
VCADPAQEGRATLGRSQGLLPPNRDVPRWEERKQPPAALYVNPAISVIPSILQAGARLPGSAAYLGQPSPMSGRYGVRPGSISTVADFADVRQP